MARQITCTVRIARLETRLRSLERAMASAWEYVDHSVKHAAILTPSEAQRAQDLFEALHQREIEYQDVCLSFEKNANRESYAPCVKGKATA